jgi:hypothetical protein
MRLTFGGIPILMTNKKIKRIFSFLILLACFYPFVKEWYRREQLNTDKKNVVTAIVTAEKYILPNHKVSFPFTFGYKFQVDGKVYSGNTHDEKYVTGDSILIEYVVGKPEYNSPLNYYK